MISREDKSNPVMTLSKRQLYYTTNGIFHGNTRDHPITENIESENEEEHTHFVPVLST